MPSKPIVSAPPARASTHPREREGELELVVCLHDEIRAVPLPTRGEITLGRAEENDVRLDYPAVSRRHALLSLGERISVTDLGGPNGTFVRDDAQRRTQEQTLNLRQLLGKSAEIAVGDSIVLGSVTLVIRRRAAARASDGCSSAGGRQAPLVISSPTLKRVYEQAAKAARANISVLILGETGAGKELLARAIHAASPRADEPFMGINCAALSETLLEGELFGYERGAFTGAVQARAGLFEAADGGTVFLDELGDLPQATQAKLLRVLEERAVMRLGARSTRKVDVRFVAATNHDLSADVAAGRFRQDLFFRLNGISLTIPPLRERPEDIEPLVQTFVIQACQQLDRPQPLHVPPDVMELLLAYPWPGNVRELKNVIERAVILCNHASLSADDLPADLVPAPPRIAARSAAVSRPIRDDIRSLERARIVSALDECGGNQTQTAKLLGISRRTLTTRLAEFALPRPRKPREALE